MFSNKIIFGYRMINFRSLQNIDFLLSYYKNFKKPVKRFLAYFFLYNELFKNSTRLFYGFLCRLLNHLYIGDHN